MNETKHPLALTLLLVVLVSALTVGLEGYYASQQSQPTSSVGALGSNLWLVTMNDTTANRALNTKYQNLQGTGQAMIVSIFLTFTTGGAASAKSNVTIYINNTSTNLWATTSRNRGSLQNLKGENQTEQLDFYVPSLFYYAVNSTVSGSGSAVIVYKWYESIPPTGFGGIIQANLEQLRRLF